MLLLYNISVRLYSIAIWLASIWNGKAAAWIAGRKNLFQELEREVQGKHERIIWMHCSSAGEFEQGKPLIEALKREYSEHKILLSFFSPSGYRVAKSYAHADYITYLPLDTRKNAERFLGIVNPELTVFIKYEFWYHHLRAAAFRHIPLLLISAVFRKDQIFFKPYGNFFRQMLFLFRHIFVQDKVSLSLLKDAGIAACTLSGDTRFDRVHKIKEAFTEIDAIRDFIGGRKVVVAGSTWEGDEKLLSEYTQKHPDVKLILAPHETAPGHLAKLQNIFGTVYLYSFITQAQQILPLPNTSSPVWVETNKEQAVALHQQNLKKTQVLIIDSVGLLSRLYYYADIAYVGGGFTRDGIHNILEAAVWNKPVVFGPNYKKYREATEIMTAGGGFSVSTAEELKKLLNDLFWDEDRLRAAGIKAEKYIEENTGATERVLTVIQENRLLTKL